MLEVVFSRKEFYRVSLQIHKRFEEMKFGTELKLKLNSQKNLNYSTFQAVFLKISKKISPVKVNVLHINNNDFMTKSLRKAIIFRSKLKNNFSKKGLMKSEIIITSKEIFVLN